MKKDEKTGLTTISEASTLEEIGNFWDSRFIRDRRMKPGNINNLNLPDYLRTFFKTISRSAI